MPSRRAPRLALEVLFLVGLAVALALADLRPLTIVGVMLLGWVVVALVEWAAWRDEPHFGSGLPPRYYVPQVSLPPRRPLEQLPGGYPAAEHRDEAPTWIASAALRSEVLGEWPVAQTPRAAGEETQDEAEAEPEVELEVEPEPVVEADAAPAADASSTPAFAAEAPVDEALEAKPEAEPVAVAAPRRRRFWQRMPVEASADGDSEAPDEVDPWLIAELPLEPESAPEAQAESAPAPTAEAEVVPAVEAVEPAPSPPSEPEAVPDPEELEPGSAPPDDEEAEAARAPAAEPEVVPAVEAVEPTPAPPSEPEVVPEPEELEPGPAPPAEEEALPPVEIAVEPSAEVLDEQDPDPPVEAPVVTLPMSVQAMASHRVDPLAGPAGRRWPWQRRNGDEAGIASVPARPAGTRVLPGSASREG
jgi:hypothetical protein